MKAEQELVCLQMAMQSLVTEVSGWERRPCCTHCPAPSPSHSTWAMCYSSWLQKISAQTVVPLVFS